MEARRTETSVGMLEKITIMISKLTAYQAIRHVKLMFQLLQGKHSRGFIGIAG